MSRATYTKQHYQDFAELLAESYNRVERATHDPDTLNTAVWAINICREEIERMFSLSNAKFDLDKWNLWIAGNRRPDNLPIGDIRQEFEVKA